MGISFYEKRNCLYIERSDSTISLEEWRAAVEATDGVRPVTREKPAAVKPASGAGVEIAVGPGEVELFNPETNAWVSFAHYEDGRIVISEVEDLASQFPHMNQVVRDIVQQLDAGETCNDKPQIYIDPNLDKAQREEAAKLQRLSVRDCWITFPAFIAKPPFASITIRTLSRQRVPIPHSWKLALAMRTFQQFESYWPQIADALVAHLPQIASTQELVACLDPHAFIEVFDILQQVIFAAKIRQGEECNRYGVVIDRGQVINVHSANPRQFGCTRCGKSIELTESYNWENHEPRRTFDCPECDRPLTEMEQNTQPQHPRSGR